MRQNFAWMLQYAFPSDRVDLEPPFYRAESLCSCALANTFFSNPDMFGSRCFPWPACSALLVSRSAVLTLDPPTVENCGESMHVQVPECKPNPANPQSDATPCYSIKEGMVCDATTGEMRNNELACRLAKGICDLCFPQSPCGGRYLHRIFFHNTGFYFFLSATQPAPAIKPGHHPFSDNCCKDRRFKISLGMVGTTHNRNEWLCVEMRPLLLCSCPPQKKNMMMVCTTVTSIHGMPVRYNHRSSTKKQMLQMQRTRASTKICSTTCCKAWVPIRWK